MENLVETLSRFSEDFWRVLRVLWRFSDISKRKVTHGCGLRLESCSFE
jgi:hypothetical protein